MVADRFAVDVFSRHYAEAREAVLAAARQAGASVTSHVSEQVGQQGEELAVDVVWHGNPDAQRVLLTTSGVHGVEGFCGSAIQRGLLLRPPPGWDPERVAMVHVHALNPHGFSWLRRVTQENVDLNRNVVDFQAPLPVNADYSTLHPHLLPATWPPALVHEQALAHWRSTWDARRWQLAITGGQHVHADGLFFGGVEPTWSQQVFRRVLSRQLGACQHLAWVDVHTGLGPRGVGERIFAATDTGETLTRARRWWGDAVTSVHTGTSTSIPMTGPVQMAVYDECPQAMYTGICLEFGTVPTEAMHAALRAEHWLHNHPDADAGLARAIKATLRDAFYPDTEDWKQAVWQQGAAVAQQAVLGLMNDALGENPAPGLPI